MPDYTPNHDFRIFSDGESGWEHRIDLESLEVDVPLLDVDANKDAYTPHQNALFIAHDTGECYRGDGAAWSSIGTIAPYEPPPDEEITSGRSTIQATDYGADPTGVASSSTALQDAINAASPGDKIVWGETGTYYLDSQITITKRIELDLYEGDIESDYHDELAYPNDQEHYMPLFRIYGTLGASTTLSQAHEKGTDQIYVTDTTLFSVGDGIVVRNQDKTQNGTTVPALDYAPTVSRIREIQDGVLYLEDELETNYASGHYATVANYLKRPIIRNVTVYPRREPTFDATAKKVLGGPRHIIATEYCDRPLVENVEAEGYDSHLWTGYDDRNARVVDCTAIRPMNLSGSCGEPFHVHGSNNPSIVRPVIRGCRRGIDARSGVSTITVKQPIVTGISFVGASWHSTSQVKSDMHIVGGRFDCRPTDPTMENKDGSLDMRQELQWGRPFMSPVNASFTAVGTTFIGRLDAVTNGTTDIIGGEIYKYSSTGTVLTISGDDVHVEGTEIGSSGPVANLVSTNTTAENVSLEDVTFDCSGGPGRAITLNEGVGVEIDGQITAGATVAAIDIGGGTDVDINVDMTAEGDYAVLINGVTNLSLAGRIKGSCANEVIQVDGGTNIDLDVDIDASATNLVRGVRIFAPEDLTVTGSYTGPAMGVLFSGNATHTVIRDMRINVTDGTTAAAAGTDTAPTALTGVKWYNNDLRGAVDTIVMNVDTTGFWAIDNITSGVSYTAGTTPTREEGNLLF